MSRGNKLAWGIITLSLAFVGWGGLIINGGTENYWLLIITTSSILLSVGASLVSYAVFPDDQGKKEKE